MTGWQQFRKILSMAVLAGALSHLSTAASEELVRPPSAPVDVASIDLAKSSLYLQYLRNNAKPPVDYVVDKFETHDAVLLGEMHEVRENCEFVSQLIQPLYRKAGVRILAMEFIRSRNTLQINHLVTAKEYDEDAVVQVFRDYAQPWGFKEYMDVLREVWRLNRKLPARAEKFRVVGLDSDWSQYDILFRLKDDTSRQKEYQSREEHMIRVLEEEVLLKGHKAMVYLGYAHTFPEGRFGSVLHRRYPDRIFWICLHHRTNKQFTDFLEAVFAQNGNESIAFDVVGSPFANLRDSTNPYFSLKEQSVFSELAHGYVFLKPVAQFKRITWVEGFVDHTNFEEVRGIALKRRWINENQCTTPEELDQRMKLIFERG